MTGFTITTPSKQVIRFRYYTEAAPVTSQAFDRLLPLTLNFMHARVSGQEIWTDKAPSVDIIQENASVFTESGEVVFGPIKPTRVKTAQCIGIYYGEGKGLDAANIFAKVIDEDKEGLKSLGEQIWKHGMIQLTLQAENS